MSDDVKMNHAGAHDLLRSVEVMGELRRLGDAVASSAGDGYEVEEWVGVNRGRVTVQPGSPRVRVREARDHNLLRGLGSVRR